jgi:hypothetical protein
MPGTQKLGDVTFVAGGALKPYKADRFLYDPVTNLPKGAVYVGHFQSPSEGFSEINRAIGRTLQWTRDTRLDGVESYTGVMP